MNTELLVKLAEQEQIDRMLSYEIGFALGAQELGLNEAQYKKFYKDAAAAIAKNNKGNATK